MRNIRDVLRLAAAGMSSRKIAASPVDRGDNGHRLPAAGAAGRAGLASPGLPGRCGAGAAPLPAVSNNEGAATAP